MFILAMNTILTLPKLTHFHQIQQIHMLYCNQDLYVAF